MPFRLLTVEQVSERLHLGVREVEHLVRRGEIPFVERGGRPSFVRREVDAWASQRLLGLAAVPAAAHHAASTARRRQSADDERLVRRLFRPEWIEPRLAARTRPAALRAMVALAASTDLLYDDAALLHGLEERERLCPTAVESGVAFLHTRYHDPNLCGDSFVVLGRAVQPIFAGAADGRATDLFFLLCCRDDALHLHALARLCAMAHATALLDGLREAASAAEMLDVLARSEEAVLRGL
jgi:excisionase family DNA binding protein